MKPASATFITSAADPGGFPDSRLPEVAICGRSNVGKSTLINALVGVSGLAKTSGTPGRTRLLNWFHVQPKKGKEYALVDLPGFGYAKVPRAMREGWKPLVEAFMQRDSVRGVVLLLDIRRGAADDERDLCGWLNEAGIPIRLVITKSDKLPKAQRKPAAVRAKIQGAPLPILCSARTGDGIDDVRFAISKLVRE